MKIFAGFFLFLVFVSMYKEASSQVLYPGYGSMPIPYDTYEDEDLGLLLTVLLLASRNKNGGSCNCCNCCNCGSSSKSIPVPYPIPFPTNNPIINNPSHFNDYDDEGDEVRTSTSVTSSETNTTKTDVTLSYTPIKLPIDDGN